MVLDAIRHNDWKTDHYLDRIPRYYGRQAESAEIAHAADVEQRTAATVLGRLEQSRWVPRPPPPP